MAVNRNKYAQEVEKQLKAGRDIDKAHAEAKKRWKIKQEKKKRKSLLERVGRKLKEIYYGGKTYSNKKYPATGRKK